MKRNDGRILLVQTFPMTMPSPEMIQQSIKKSNGRLYLTGRMQFADKLNGNERYYPKAILQRQIEKYQQKIKSNQSVGECDHPDSDQINPKNVAFLTKQVHWNGDEVIGTIMLTSNSVGKDMQALVEDGVTLSISSRGLGSLKRTKKGDEVQDDFQLVGWDLVIEPSTPNASFWNNGQIHQSSKSEIDFKVERLLDAKQTTIDELSHQILSLLK